MESQYPTPLIERIMKYFKDKYGQDISSATATEYLDSLADLHTSFVEFLEYNANKEKVLPDSSGF